MIWLAFNTLALGGRMNPEWSWCGYGTSCMNVEISRSVNGSAERPGRQKYNLGRKAAVGEQWSARWHSVQYSGHYLSSLMRLLLPLLWLSRHFSLIIISSHHADEKNEAGRGKEQHFQNWTVTFGVSVSACLKGTWSGLSHGFHEPRLSWSV